MTTPPRRNLPPAAEAWGRYVDKRLSELEASDVVHRVNVGASIQSVASSSHHLGEFKRGTEHALGEVAERVEQLDEDLEVVGNAFTTSESPPTPEDAEGKPEGAYWTQIDSAGEQIARWRLVDGEWVDAPLGMTFIPEIGTDKIIASEAGFDTAVANQMFVDIFTANQVTADQIDVNSLAAHTGFIDNLFSHNLSLTGELTALSEDFTTVLSQSGLQMFANNSLDFVQQWPVTGAPTSGGHVSGIASSGDYLYTIIPAEGSALSNPNQFRRYDLDGNDLGDTDSAAGWRFFELAANATHLYALAEEIGPVSPRHRRLERRALDGTLLGTIPAGSGFPNERVTRFAPMDNGNIVAVVLAPEHQRIELWDQNGNVIRVLEVIDSANWSVQYLTTDGQHVYYHIIFGWVGAPRYVRQLTTTGDHYRDIHLPSTVSSLSTYGNTLWVGLQQTVLLVAYDTATGAPTFVSKLHDVDQAGNLQANNGHIYGVNAFWNVPGPEPVIYQYEISGDANLRVSIDNFEGRLIAQELESQNLTVRGWQVTPSTKRYIRGASIFASLEPGISVASNSLAVIDEAEDGATVTMSVTIYGIDRSAGNQQIRIGTLHPDLAPRLAVALPGYYTNGTATAAITSVVSVSLRWSSGSASTQIFYATSYAIDRGD